MLTYQDFLKDTDREGFIARLIREHEEGELCRTARIADQYDARRNVTINEFARVIYTSSGRTVQDFTASNSRIASGFFPRLNTQRCTYLLGNGVTFAGARDELDKTGKKVRIDETKERLGERFDTDLYHAAYKALIHGVVFVFWNKDRLHAFPVTEFAPLWDEESGALRAGARYWRIDEKKPAFVTLYEEDGYTLYRSEGAGMDLKEAEGKRSYLETVRTVPADNSPQLIGGANYGALPIAPLWGSRVHQSTLIGMREAIDSYDMIRSGFANDLNDCAQIYWLLENYGGMDDKDIAEFRDRVKLQHIAVADTSSGGKVQGYTQEIPYQARQIFLDQIRQGIYEDFGALNVANISAAAKTATEIDAAYQPMDENADDFEYQIVECVQQILALIGIVDTPVFKRNRISNQLEQVQMVMLEAPYLDDATILKKLPNITPDEAEEVMTARLGEETTRFASEGADV